MSIGPSDRNVSLLGQTRVPRQTPRAFERHRRARQIISASSDRTRVVGPYNGSRRQRRRWQDRADPTSSSAEEPDMPTSVHIGIAVALGLAVAAVAGCTVYEAAPGYYVPVSPASFDRSWTAALGAFD